MTFQPGQSGNPSGRPKANGRLRDLARAHTEEALAKLIHLMDKGTSEQVQLDAANSLLDRGWGKPTQHIAGQDDGPVEVSVTDARERVLQRLMRLRSDEEEVVTPGDDPSDSEDAGIATSGGSEGRIKPSRFRLPIRPRAYR